MLTAHRLFVAVFALPIVLALHFAGHAQAEDVKIGIPSLSVTTMPLAVAKEQRFFQEEGLNAEMVLMPAALNIKVLLSGDIQYATTVGSAVVAAIRGINTRVVMCFVDRPLLDLVATPDIRSISDLKGKNSWEFPRAAVSMTSRCGACSPSRGLILPRQRFSRSARRVRCSPP